MSGWIKIEKDITTDPRFLRMARALRNGDETQQRISERESVTRLLGCLTYLWIYADTHIREDDTLDLGADEVNEVVGLQGFAQLMPPDWLEVIDAHSVKLPGFQLHNGTEAKKKALTQKRVERHRIRSAVTPVDDVQRSGVNSALPDQTRPDLDQTRPSESTAAAPPRAIVPRTTFRAAAESGWLGEFRELYPKRSGDQGWSKAARAGNARLQQGHTVAELLDGARRYAAYVRAKGDEGTEYVKQAATFLGPDKHFAQAWTLPPTKAQLSQDANVSASLEWLSRQENQNAAG